MTPATPGVGLLVDLQATQSLEHAERGISRYAEELTRQLVRVPGLVDALLLNPVLPFPGHIHPELLRSPLLRWNTAGELRRRRQEARHPLAYLALSPIELGPPSRSVIPDHVVSAGLPLACVLYDLIPLRIGAHQGANRAVAARYHLRLEWLRACEVVLALSEQTADDAVTLLGLDRERITVIGGGVSERFVPEAATTHDSATGEAAAPASGEVRRDVLYVGGTHPRKNTEGLLRAWGRLPAGLRGRHRLVIVCDLDEPVRRHWTSMAREAGAEDSVVVTGRVDDARLLELYRSARLFVFPSLVEGFGLPVAEAIACGAPAITSADPAVAAILDLPESTFEARDDAAIAAALERALTDERFLERLRARGAERAPLWRWERVAEQALAALARLQGGAARAASQPAPPLRLALATSALDGGDDPARSPMAGLAIALRDRCRLRLLTPGRVDRAWLDLTGIERLPLAALERGVPAAEHDLVVYAVDGRDEDEALLAQARCSPGLVWLRRVDLAGFAWRAAQRRHGAAAGAVLAEQVREEYGPRAPQGLLRALQDGRLDESAVRRHGVLMVGAWLWGARALAVGSERDARRLLLDRGPHGIAAAAAVLAADAPPGVVADALVALAAGIVAEAAPAREETPQPAPVR